MTSSPGPTPSASRATCSPAVADDTGTANLPPTYSAKALLNFSTFGPVVIQPERRVSTTSAISSSPSAGRAKGRNVLRISAQVYRLFRRFLQAAAGEVFDAGRAD